MNLQFSELFLCLQCVQSPVQTSGLSREGKSGAAKGGLAAQLCGNLKGLSKSNYPNVSFNESVSDLTFILIIFYNTNQVASQLSLQLVFYIFRLLNHNPYYICVCFIASKFCLTSNLLYHCGLQLEKHCLLIYYLKYHGDHVPVGHVDDRVRLVADGGRLAHHLDAHAHLVLADLVFGKARVAISMSAITDAPKKQTKGEDQI